MKWVVGAIVVVGVAAAAGAVVRSRRKPAHSTWTRATGAATSAATAAANGVKSAVVR
jgi:hypothetical protein